MALWEGYYWSWESSHYQRCEGDSAVWELQTGTWTLSTFSLVVSLFPSLLRSAFLPFSFCLFLLQLPTPVTLRLSSLFFSILCRWDFPLLGRQMSTGNAGLLFYFREVRGKRTLSVSFSRRIPRRLVWLVSWTNPGPCTVTGMWGCKI